jgi:hypothetical protein
MRTSVLIALLLTLSACMPGKQKFKAPGLEFKKTHRVTLFIGVDISGSFVKTRSFRDGVEFLGEYIWAHLNEKGGLSAPVDMYVGGIGGNSVGDPQNFFPIHEFKGLSASQISAKLNAEFSKKRDNLTDFNQFFKRIRQLVEQKNLVLHPIELLMVTDGVPEIQCRGDAAIKQAYEKIEVSVLEHLARDVSVRILYANPKVGNNWRIYVPTKRIKVWTVEPRVMFGWTDQKKRLGMEGLWAWMRDNIDLKMASR